ncbi:hypothetical protein E2C01_101884 [Portunus trituberculatus]|uniref:Uncharacterized protein n=1 Tax=Portunus trituberculatus TaxID=210409 RepID=A0A5B7KH08_PORTR|nr:hypothetical protein [Portunus trituberculatus]
MGLRGRVGGGTGVLGVAGGCSRRGPAVHP